MAEPARSRRADAGLQLALLEPETASWRLDDQTREVGRRGVAEARAALSRSAGGRHAGEHRHRAEAA